ncbi:MAG: SAM-dependent methyltransferase [candidate division NC10 bacterium]|nr:SAM-dependent methyltransferase [candidate division NC10 bacterium]
MKAFSIHLGILLLSTATLALEVSLTRIFSVSLWYHFAFLVISLALLGFGASGSLLALCPALSRGELHRWLSDLSAAFAASLLFAYLLILALPLDPYLLFWDRLQLLFLFIYYLAWGVPFLAAGCALGLALTRLSREAGRIYASNLVGSAIGCLALVLAVPLFGGPGVLLLSALLALLASLSFGFRLSRLRLVALTLPSLALLFILLYFSPRLPLPISEYKGLRTTLTLPDARILFTEWSTVSRVDVIESRYLRLAPGLSLLFRGEIPPQLGLAIDGEGLSPITRFDGDVGTLAFTDYLSSSLTYHLKEGPKVLILGPGGGLDILAALYHRARAIVAVELDPSVAKAVGERFTAFAGGLYRLPHVRVKVAEGRSFIRRGTERYDIIQISLLDSFAATAAGVSSLNENYLYTVEALQDYYTRLEPGGILSITRWLRLPPRDEVRIFATALTALEELGLPRPREHLAFIRSWSSATILLKRDPFTPYELQKIRRFSEERGFDLVYLPDLRPEELNRFNRLEEPYYNQVVKKLLDKEGRGEFYRNYLFDIEPAIDDKPFFFHFFKWKSLGFLLTSLGRQHLPLGEWGYLVLLAALAQALLASSLLVLLPLMFRRGLPHGGARALLYFAALGLGFIFIEIALIQKFVLFLGHPTYALTVILFSLLLFSGIGSYLSGILPIRPWRRVSAAIAGISLLTLVYLWALPLLFRTLIGEDLPWRVLLAVLLLGPLGLLMGVPFPSGIEILGRDSPGLIPWAWGINGSASVIASILAILIAVSWGFRAVLALAALIYLAGLGAMAGYRGSH